MNILATSDMHGNLEGLDPSGFDIVAIAGDFSLMKGFGKWHMHDQKKWIEKKFFSWTSRYPAIQFVVVPGNHDLCLDRNLVGQYQDISWNIKWPENVHLLIDSYAEINGMKFYGSPWVPTISHRWAFEADDVKQKEMFSKIPENLDFLVVHSPPHLFSNCNVDRSTQYGISDAFGSNILANEIFAKKPKHVICGHIHSGDHSIIDFEGSKIFNVSRVNEDYDIAYEPSKIVVDCDMNSLSN